MRTKKVFFITTILALLVLLGLGSTSMLFSIFRKKPNPTPSSPTTITVNGTLNESLSKATGDNVMTISEDITLTVNDGGKTLLGKAGMKSVVIDGENKGSITASGGKESVIRAVDGATLTFKNLTVNDDTPERGKAYADYLWLGGALTFENCTFTDSIYLKKDVTAVFKNCTFNSVHNRYYSVWIGDGSARFEDCTFKGYRGLKIHEWNEEETKSVHIVNCVFDNLFEKPGLAIGTLNKETIVNVRDSTFDGCVAWDTVGSLTGVDGAYECDTPLSGFTFAFTNNEVKNTKYKIEYKAVIEGKAVQVPTAMYKPSGEYPTHFKAGESVTVSDLWSICYNKNTDYEFKGWYLDEACTQAFDGTIENAGNITLYANISVALWTDNY